MAFDFSVAMSSWFFFNSFGLWVLCILLTRKYECYNVIELDLNIYDVT